MSTPQNEWGTTADVARMLGITEETIRKLRRRGGPLRDQAVKIGHRTIRYHLPSLTAALRQGGYQ